MRTADQIEKLKEKARERANVYYAQHREEVKSKGGAYRRAHLLEKRIRDSIYQRTNRTRITLRTKAWYHTPAGRSSVLASHHRYRAKKRGNNHLSGMACLSYNVWLKDIRNNVSFICFWCRGIYPIDLLHVDHVVPIYFGGIDGRQSVVPSCQSCNQRKGDKNPSDWLAEIDPTGDRVKSEGMQGE